MHNKMYKAGWSSNIQIVSGQKIALCMYMYGINIKIQDKKHSECFKTKTLLQLSNIHLNIIHS